MAMMNISQITNEQQCLDVPLPPPGRIRSHSLKPRHSKLDYARRQSAAGASSVSTTPPPTTTITTGMKLSTENSELQKANTPPPRRTSTPWFQRRFTVFSFDQQQNASSNQQRRMTMGRYSVFSDKPNANLIRQKRPSVISQVVESFTRRFSLGKKKHHNDSEPNETIVDPVYETLKMAAETRKMAVANYLQQRQQTLNKQVSLNSQGSSELDIQSSPKASRHASRTEAEITSTLRPTLPSGNRQGASSIDNARVTNC
ncbi:unnamed protein product [Rotaria socialis]|uniref:Uncharacterized protein n=1 Tax=Rotaria socialis TaxID=392032 RepID=A0A818EJU6_9BILA|nr:unnamed protein product [Rotaria socialis]CAF3329102.1 unnamed protein product [Rotaria socialis]CAF3388289.1 unnamed protein product [Rotaria socialis]CAF3460262.1 unnamed protein product [Rotaria socialis]CAF3651627.1 unnamed protein product [Rotaria socialis]